MHTVLFFVKDKKTCNLMDEPEPLILEYGLDDWKNKTFKGANKLMLAKYEPKDKYSSAFYRIGVDADSSIEE